jgi:hypothetical protein
MIRFTVKFDDYGMRRLERNLRSLEQTRSVSFAELFTTEFMRAHTQVRSFDELLSVGGFEVSSAEDFRAIPDAEWEVHSCTRARRRGQAAVPARRQHQHPMREQGELPFSEALVRPARAGNALEDENRSVPSCLRHLGILVGAA